MNFLKNKSVWSFVGGALASTLGVSLLTSKKAKNVYAQAIAKGMVVTDDLKAGFADVKGEAMDIYENAKVIAMAEANDEV